MEKLLDYFTPENYNLTLNIDKANKHVRGKTIITGTPKRDTIKFHAQDLKINAVKIDEKPANFTLENGEIILPKGEKIQIDYTFKLNKNMEGAYLSTYQYQDHEEILVTTQFESHYARQCFPCIDEPAAKATFDLKIISQDEDDEIISNMPKKSERTLTYDTVGAPQNADNLTEEDLTLNSKNTVKIATFETTPKMSTYLLAFCVGKFQKYETTNKHGVKITTYAALNQDAKKLIFPTEIAAETLDYYDDLFGTEYPLKKLDQVAVPDFEAGAMENWGLVTYRESCLLADDTTAQDSKEYIATVITHELSHQWFGDLVTMAWWDDLWLNESFASVMQYLSVADLHPDWDIWEDFFTGDCNIALRRDAVPGVQAVKQEVNDPAEIATLFDGAIVYAKGAHLIFMLIRLMGREQFFKGVKDYFKAHAYQNTIGDDLWAALQPYAKFDVKEFMNAWISQSGFPVITNKDQKRFMITGETDGTTWPLPEITDDMSGHYILNLSKDEFQKKFDDFDKLSLEQRLRLLLDRQLLAKTDLASPADFFDLLPHFKSEKSFAVWELVSMMIGELKSFFPPSEPELRKKYQVFVMDIIKERLDALGYKSLKDENFKDAKLRSLLVSNALYAEDPETTKQLAEQYDDDLYKIDPEMRDDVITAKLRFEHEENFGKLVQLYRETPDPDLRANLLSAFTDAKTHTDELIALLEDTKTVRPQDHIYLFADLLFNFETRAETYDWFYSHWDYVKEIAGEKSLDDYLRVSAARILTEEDQKRFEEFVKPHEKDPALKRGIAVAKVDIAARLAWLAKNRDSVRAKLDKA